MLKNFLSEKIVTTIISRVSEGDMRGLWSIIKKATVALAIVAVLIIVLTIVCLILFINFLFSTLSTNEETTTSTTSEIVAEPGKVTGPTEMNLGEIKDSLITETEALVPGNLFDVTITELIESVKAFFASYI